MPNRVEEEDRVVRIGAVKSRIVSAGYFWSDGGAAMGILPRAIWERNVEVDEKHRIRMDFNLLLLDTGKKVFLVDTGLGNRISEKEKKIFKASEFTLVDNLEEVGYCREDIDGVIMTHLHFDHAGGVVSDFGNGDELTFPNAIHYIQEVEWTTARHPDELNASAYQFDHQLRLLEESEQFRLVNGDVNLTPEIRLILAGGHSNGFQVVRVESGEEIAYYGGDIFPQKEHLRPSVTSAYEVDRTRSFRYKRMILDELRPVRGRLFLAHDKDVKSVRIDEQFPW